MVDHRRDGPDRSPGAGSRDPDAGRPAPVEVVQLYRRSFREFGAIALWNLREVETPTLAQALAITRQLRTEGDMRARGLAEAIERACRADL